MKNFNDDKLSGNWSQVKGEIRKAWGNITGDELEKAKGDMTHVAGLIQEKYGIAKEDASARLSEIVDRFSKSAKDVADKVKDKSSSLSDTAKHSVAQGAEKIDKKAQKSFGKQ